MVSLNLKLTLGIGLILSDIFTIHSNSLFLAVEALSSSPTETILPNNDKNNYLSNNSLIGVVNNTIDENELDKWKSELPLALQKRRTLYHFFLPTQKNDNDDNDDANDACEVYLLGTSHISADSCDDVRLLMEYARPDCLFLELCPQRVPILDEPPPPPPPTPPSPLIEKKKGWFLSRLRTNPSPSSTTPNIQNPSLFKQIETIQAQTPGMTKSSALTTMLFTQVQSDYATKLNITLGSEFREAFQMALQQNYYHNSPSSSPCRIVLGDRPVKLTLLRTWESLHFISKIKLVLGLIWSSLPFNQPSSAEIKEWMDSILNDSDGGEDVLSKSMKELSKHFPTIKHVIIHERDLYMYAKLNQLAQQLSQIQNHNHPSKLRCKRIVAVVGAGHCKGICNLVKQREVGIELGYRRPNDENYEQMLKNIIETERFKADQDDNMKSLLTEVVEVDIQQPPNPYYNHPYYQNRFMSPPTDFITIQ